MQEPKQFEFYIVSLDTTVRDLLLTAEQWDKLGRAIQSRGLRMDFNGCSRHEVKTLVLMLAGIDDVTVETIRSHIGRNCPGGFRVVRRPTHRTIGR